MNYININDLDVIGEVKLIFEANLDMSKGKSNKSYSIKLPDTSRNNNALQGMFSSYIGRKVSYPAIYTVQGVTLTGILLITDIERHLASGVFISGNGVVWQAMKDDKLSDIDLSEYDIKLNKTNVLASESGYPMVVFDLVDRGQFKGGTSEIDIADRYPAINIKQLLIKLFNAYGFYLDVEDNTGYFNQLYLLFTRSDEIRNDAEWLQDSVFEAEAAPPTEYTDSGPSTKPVFEIYKKLQFPNEITDNGGNYDHATHEYTVPQTGTYSFIYDYYLYIERPNIATVSGLSCSIRLSVNGVVTAVQSIDVTNLTGYDTFVIRQGTYNSRPTEYDSGDVISMYIYFSGTISTGSSWTVRVTQYKDTSGFLNKFYVIPSRWYGAGSTIEINNILPKLTVSNFIKDVLVLLNAEVYFNENENATRLVVGRMQREPVAEVECYNYSEVLEEKTNTVISFATDKARPQPDKLIKLLGAKEIATIDVNYSRTLIAPCYRLFSETQTKIPILWQAGDPLDFEQAKIPPEQKTTANLRILRKATAVSGSYYLSYGGILPSNKELQTSVLQFVEADIRSLHIYDSTIERKLIQCNAKLDVSKLYDNTYFENDITLKDRRSGNILLIGRLKKAEQLRGNNYKLTIYTTAQEQIDATVTEWTTPAEVVNTTSQSGTGSSGGTSAYVPPTDMWQRSVAGQISALDEKESIADADNFVIDDSADDNKKKRITWTRVKSILKTYFDTLYNNFSISKATGAEINTGTDDAKYVTSLSIRNSNIFSAEKSGQFSSLTEKTSMLPNDAFVVENAAGGAKRLLKWSQIKATNDNLYYGSISRQFYVATAEKTSLAANDRLIMEDSADSYAKKSFKWSTVRTTLDAIYYGAFAGQFAATTEKTSVAANDIFVIEDSASSNAKKSLKYSTIKTALDLLYGFWASVTNGIKTTLKVGIGADATSSYQLYVQGGAIQGAHFTSTAATAISADSVSSTDPTALFTSSAASALTARFSGASTNTEVEVLSIERTTSGTAANGIGGLLRFGLENASGTVIYPVYIGARLADATTGAGELTLYCNSALRAKINAENDFEVSSGGSAIVQSGDAYYLGAKSTDGSWRIIMSGNDLVFQRRESGSWVTKQTISA